MLGIIIAVICSNWVGEAINSDGIYETDLEADGTVIFLRPSPPHTLYTKTAADIAARAVWCVPGSLGAKAAQLWRCSFNCALCLLRYEFFSHLVVLPCCAPGWHGRAIFADFETLQTAHAGASER